MGNGMQMKFSAILVFFVSLLVTLMAHATSERSYEITEERELCADFEPLRRPFFGDTHVHTAFSFDALVFCGGAP